MAEHKERAMEWSEKERTDGKGVFYESKTPGGLPVMVIQPDNHYPLWRGSIDVGVRYPGLFVGATAPLALSPTYSVNSAKDAMGMIERVALKLGL